MAPVNQISKQQKTFFLIIFSYVILRARYLSLSFTVSKHHTGVVRLIKLRHDKREQIE